MLEEMSETERLLEEISGKLDRVLRLLAINSVREISTEQGKIESLDLIGFRPSEIAMLLNKSQDNINVQLSLIQKKKSKAMKIDTTEGAQSENVKSDSNKLSAAQEGDKKIEQ